MVYQMFGINWIYTSNFYLCVSNGITKQVMVCLRHTVIGL